MNDSINLPALTWGNFSQMKELHTKPPRSKESRHENLPKDFAKEGYSKKFFFTKWDNESFEEVKNHFPIRKFSPPNLIDWDYNEETEEKENMETY